METELVEISWLAWEFTELRMQECGNESEIYS